MEITSPVKRFPGTVVMPDFLTLPQVLDFEETEHQIHELRESDGSVSFTKINAIQLPFILGTVLEWRIEGIPAHPTIETFPMSPRVPTAQLLTWIIREVTSLYIGEVEIPND